MKKAILALSLVIVLAIIGAVYFVLTNLDSLVKAAIEKHGSEATQTAVRVSRVKIELTEGAAAIHGLTIANPKGFSTPYAFSLGEIGGKIDIKSLQEEPYVIDAITVRAPQVFMEINQEKKTNLNELKKNLAARSNKTKTQAAKDKADKTPHKEPRLIIRRLLFADGAIQAKIVPLDNKEYTLKLPTLIMNNLGGKKGTTPRELANEILNRLTDAAQQEIKKQGLDKELEKLKAEAKAKVEAEKAKLQQKADTKLEEEKQKAEEQLKGLLGQ